MSDEECMLLQKVAVESWDGGGSRRWGRSGSRRPAPGWPGRVRGGHSAQWRMVCMSLLKVHRPSLVAHMHERSKAVIDKA